MRKMKKDLSPSDDNVYNLLNIPKIQDDDIERLLIYGEYIKRKFYIDSSYTTIQSKNKFKYLRNSLHSKDECMNYLLNKFITDEDKSNFQRKCFANTKFMETFDKYEYNIYKIIKHNFHNQIEILKKIISFPEDYCDYKYINNQEMQFLKETSKIVILDYEVILYRINPDQPFIEYDTKYQNNPLINFIRIINNAFKSYFDECFLILYRNILDKYYLYMDYLFQIINMEDVINDDYHFPDWPHFFSLPLEKDEEYLPRNIDVKLDELDMNITLKIGLTHNFDSIQIADYVRKILLNILFYYKNSQKSISFPKEIQYFINKFDSDNKHNKIHFYSRIHGLYIWDKIHICNNKTSINSICMNFNKKFPNRKDKKDNEDSNMVNLYRCYIGTLRSIEDLSFRQLK